MIGRRARELRVVIGCLAAATMMLLTRSAHAQEEQRKAEAWLNQEWDRSRGLPDLDGLRLRWRVEEYYVPSSADLTRLRKEVATHADHTDKPLLELYEQRVQGKPTTTVWTIWMKGTKQWRLNSTVTQPPGEYWDQVVTPKTIWTLYPAGYELVPQDNPDPEVDFQSLFASRMNDAKILLSGGMFVPARYSALLFLDRAHFVVQAEGRKPGLKVVIDGRWDSQVERGFIERLVFHPAHGPPNEYRAFNWHFDDSLRAWVPERVEWWQGEPLALDRVLVLETCESQEQGEFARVTAEPSQGGMDPIRGPINARVILDDRRRIQTITDQQTGIVSQTKMAPSPRQRNASLLRTTAWITTGCLIAGLACLALYQHVRRRRITYPTRKEHHREVLE